MILRVPKAGHLVHIAGVDLYSGDNELTMEQAEAVAAHEGLTGLFEEGLLEPCAELLALAPKRRKKGVK